MKLCFMPRFLKRMGKSCLISLGTEAHVCWFSVFTKTHIFPGLPHAFRMFQSLPQCRRWDELMAESVLWSLGNSVTGTRPGEWKIEK